MTSTKAAVALLVSVLIAAMTAANATIHDHTWLTVITIALAAANPIAVWAASNKPTGGPPPPQ